MVPAIRDQVPANGAKKVVIIGGSDVGIITALRVKDWIQTQRLVKSNDDAIISEPFPCDVSELFDSFLYFFRQVSVVPFPNFSICG